MRGATLVAASIATPPLSESGSFGMRRRAAQKTGAWLPSPSGGSGGNDFRPVRPLPQGASGACRTYANRSPGVNPMATLRPDSFAMSMLFVAGSALFDIGQDETSPHGVGPARR